MSNPQTSLSNTNPNATAMAAGVPSAVGSSSENVASFDPRDLHVDPTKYRIGGFLSEPVDHTKVPAIGDVDLNALDNVDLNAVNVNANTNAPSTVTGETKTESGPSGLPSTAEASADEKTEQEQAREQREQKFLELLHSGQLGTAKPDEQFSGRKYTLPVVKPKLL